MSTHAQRELVAAAVSAARQARQALAEAIRALTPIDEPLTEDLAFAVGALFRAEVDEPTAVLDRMREAAAVMSGVLSRLHAPELSRGLDLAGGTLARGLALLYPARAGLERSLAEEAASDPLPSPPMMLFEKPLVATFPRPAEAPRVYAPSDEVPRSERTATREPLAARPDDARPSDRPAERPSERPSGRPRRNAVELSPDADAGLVDRQGQSGSIPPSERRHQDRAEFTVDIGLHTSTQFFAGISGDLSEGGLFVATYTPKPIGTELHVSFVLTGGHAISTPAIVAWIRESSEAGPEPGMGLRFYGLSDADKKVIERFLKMRPPMLYEP